jgi:hypothetical protein
MEAVVKPPRELVFEEGNTTDWPQFRKRFETYMEAIGGEELNLSEKRKCAILFHIIGERAVEIFETFEIKKETLKEVLDQFEEYFVPKVNVTVERYKFFTCVQEENQTVDELYVVSKVPPSEKGSLEKPTQTWQRS